MQVSMLAKRAASGEFLGINERFKMQNSLNSALKDMKIPKRQNYRTFSKIIVQISSKIPELSYILPFSKLLIVHRTKGKIIVQIR